jgi:hypothetical protein
VLCLCLPQVFAAAIPAQLNSLEQALKRADVSMRASGSDMDTHRQQVSCATGAWGIHLHLVMVLQKDLVEGAVEPGQMQFSRGSASLPDVITVHTHMQVHVRVTDLTFRSLYTTLTRLQQVCVEARMRMGTIPLHPIMHHLPRVSARPSALLCWSPLWHT